MKALMSIKGGKGNEIRLVKSLYSNLRALRLLLLNDKLVIIGDANLGLGNVLTGHDA